MLLVMTEMSSRVFARYGQEFLGLGPLFVMVTNKAVLPNAIFALWLSKNQPVTFWVSDLWAYKLLY